jgi:hypothetical protein
VPQTGGLPPPQPPPVAPPRPPILVVKHDDFAHGDRLPKPDKSKLAVILQPDAQVAQPLAKPFIGATRVAIIARAKGSQSFNNGATKFGAPVTEVMGYMPGWDEPRIAWKVRRPEKIATVKFQLFSRSAKDTPLWTLEWTGGDVATKLAKDPYKEKVDKGDLQWTGTLPLTEVKIAKDLKIAGDKAASFPDGAPTIEHSPYKLLMTVTVADGDKKLAYPTSAWTYFQCDPLQFENEVRAKAERDYWAYAEKWEARLGYWLAVHPKTKEGADLLVGKLRALALPEKKSGFEARYVALMSREDFKQITGGVKRKYKDMDIAFREGNLREKMGMLYMAFTGGTFEQRLRAVYDSTKREEQGLVDRAYMKTELETIAAMDEKEKAKKKKGDKPRVTSLFFRTPSWAKWAGPDCKGYVDQQDLHPNLKPREFTPENNQVPLNYRELKGALGDPKTKGTAGFLHTNYIWGQRGEWAKVPEEERRVIIMDEFLEKSMPWLPGKEFVKIIEGGPLESWGKQMKVRLLASMSGSTDMYCHGARYLGIKGADLELVRLAALGSMIPAGDHSFFEIMFGARPYLGDDSFLADDYPRCWEGYEKVATGPIAKADVEQNVGKFPGVLLSPERLKQMSDHFHGKAFDYLNLPDKCPYDLAKRIGAVELTDKQKADIWASWDGSNGLKVVAEKAKPAVLSTHTVKQRGKVADAERDETFKAVMRLVKTYEDTKKPEEQFAALAQVLYLVDKYEREKAGANDAQTTQVKRIFADLRPYYHEVITELDEETPVPFFYYACIDGEPSGPITAAIKSLLSDVKDAKFHGLESLTDNALTRARTKNKEKLARLHTKSSFKALLGHHYEADCHMMLASIIQSITKEPTILEDFTLELAQEYKDKDGKKVRVTRNVAYAALAKNINTFRYNYQADTEALDEMLQDEGDDSFAAKNYQAHAQGADNDLDRNLQGEKIVRWGGKIPDPPSENGKFKMIVDEEEVAACRALHPLEKAAIGHYSGGAYVQYTGWDVPEDNVLLYQAAVISAVHKLPKYKKPIFRGAGYPSKGMQVGQIFTYTALTSTAGHLTGSFAAQRGKASYVLYPRSGARIDYLAMKPFEYEVMMPPGTRFRVTAVHDFRKAAKVPAVTLDQATMRLDGPGGMPPGLNFDDPRVRDPHVGERWRTWYLTNYTYKVWIIAEEI